MADENYDDLYNSDVVDVDGEKVGAVGQVYLDDATGEPTWVTVKTGLFGTKETFVPLQDAQFGDGKIVVAYTEDFIKDAPGIDPDRHLDASEEAELYRYYGIPTAADVPAAAPVVEREPGVTDAPLGDDAAVGVTEAPLATPAVDATTDVIVDETGPLGDEPVADVPVGETDIVDPMFANPSVAGPIVGEDAIDEPVEVVADPIIDEPIVDEPVVGKPVVDELATDPVIDDVVAEPVVIDKPVDVVEPLAEEVEAARLTEDEVEVPGDAEDVIDAAVPDFDRTLDPVVDQAFPVDADGTVHLTDDVVDPIVDEVSDPNHIREV